MLLVVGKNLLFHLACLRRARPYLALKGRIIRTVSRLGGYERAYMRLLPLLIRPGSDVIDVGANAGAYTLALSRAVGPAGRVFAFEPIPVVAEELERACRLLANVTVLRALLSDRTGVTLSLQIPVLPGGVPEPALASVEHLSRNSFGAAPWTILRLETSQLDDHMAHFRDVSFMKVDIEGHEASFLSGATRTIQAFRPVLQVEAGGLGRAGEAVRAWMQQHDYAMFALDGRWLVDTGAGDTSLNVYLVPHDRVADLPDVLLHAPGAGR